MNVNILKDDPDWRWFPLAASICLASTLCAWLMFKYCPVSEIYQYHVPGEFLTYVQIETWMENKFGKRIHKLIAPSASIKF
jgi:hypothetical protein